jgi:hypothetical protein
LIGGVKTILVIAKSDELIGEIGEISYIIDDEVDDIEVFESDFDGVGFSLCLLSIHL